MPLTSIKLACDGEVRRFPVSALTLAPDGDFEPVCGEHEYAALLAHIESIFPQAARRGPPRV